MLLAIFYARFHPSRGPSIIHKYPADFIISSHHPTISSTPEDHSSQQPQILWPEISPYIIPPYELCNRALSVRNNGYTILGWPVSLESDRYPRNRFTFNVCFVLSEQEDTAPWEVLVQKTARFFASLEEEDALLLAEEQQQQQHGKEARLPGEGGDLMGVNGGGSVVCTLLEGVFEDVNAFGEACVRLDDLHVLNLRLFRSSRPVPRRVEAWEVPLLIRELPRPEEWTWDLTLEKIFPFINGVNHVLRIAELADVEVKLVKKAVRELVYHERVLLLDIFHFQAVYMLTEAFTLFAKDETLQEECLNYISIDPATNPLAASSTNHLSGQSNNDNKPITLTKVSLISLYRALSPGLNLQTLIQTHDASTLISTIDPRRLITFGVLKGFVRRVHRFALAVQNPASTAASSLQQSPGRGLNNGGFGAQEGQSLSRSHENGGGGGGEAILPARESSADAREAFDRAWRKAALSSGWATPPSEPPVGFAAGTAAVAGTAAAFGAAAENKIGEGTGGNAETKVDDEKLRRYLDGKHCLDQICVEMHLSEKRVVERLVSGRFGEVIFFCR